MAEAKRGGFASMTPERRAEVASKGGKSAFDKGVIYRFTSEKAKEAGRKGGLAKSANRAAREAGRR